MPEIVKTKYHDSEVAKSSDFGHTAAEAVVLASAIIDGMNEDVANSFVFSGLQVEQTDPASMNVLLRAGLAFDRFGSQVLHLNADLNVPVTASSPTLERIDTVEVRFKETDFDVEQRAFKDPSNGTVSYMDVATRTLVSIEARCLAGTPGAGAAPLVEFGWVKLAEVRVQAAASAIYAADIRGLTAERDTVENSAWTVEKAATFRLGSMAALKALLNTHTTSNITAANTVHGVRQGHTNGFDADTLDGSHAGAGNGLNADLLDGQHAAAFASAAQGSTADNALPAASYTAADVMNKVQSLDGAESGLDADMVDGKHAAELASPGDVKMTAALSAPSGWLLCNGAAVSRTTYAALFGAISASKGNPTIQIASPAVVTLNGHGLATGDCIELTTTGALPDGLSVNTSYYVIYVDANSFRLATTLANALAGTAINVSGSQSGTHSLRHVPWGVSGSNFYLPDFREAAPAMPGSRAAGVTEHDVFLLGQFKDDQAQDHKHEMLHYRGATGGGSIPGTGDTNLTSYQYATGGPVANGGGTPRIGSVTRGKRVGVNFIIKY